MQMLYFKIYEKGILQTTTHTYHLQRWRAVTTGCDNAPEVPGEDMEASWALLWGFCEVSTAQPMYRACVCSAAFTRQLSGFERLDP